MAENKRQGGFTSPYSVAEDAFGVADGEPITASALNGLTHHVSEHVVTKDEFKMQQEAALKGLQKKMEEKKNGLLEVSIEVLQKRLAEAEARNATLEQRIEEKDQRIDKLVDTIINKLGGDVGG